MKRFLTKTLSGFVDAMQCYASQESQQELTEKQNSQRVLASQYSSGSLISKNTSEAQDVSSGEGVKKDAGKLRYDLIPVKPLAEVAKIYTVGAIKYEDRNWEKGMRFGRIYAAMQRHLNAFWDGEDLDPETRCHHLASVCFGALALMELQNTHPELDDRPHTD